MLKIFVLLLTLFSLNVAYGHEGTTEERSFVQFDFMHRKVYPKEELPEPINDESSFVPLQINAQAMILLATALFLGSLAAYWVYRRRDRFSPVRPSLSYKAGFGGWFCLVFMGTLLHPLLGIRRCAAWLFGLDVSFATCINTLYVALELPFAVCLIILMIQRHVSFPRLTIVGIFARVLPTIYCAIATYLDTRDLLNLAFWSIWTICILSIRIPYLITSKQVRSTFVNKAIGRPENVKVLA